MSFQPKIGINLENDLGAPYVVCDVAFHFERNLSEITPPPKIRSFDDTERPLVRLDETRDPQLPFSGDLIIRKNALFRKVDGLTKTIWPGIRQAVTP